MNDSVACIVLNYNDFDTTISLIKKIRDYKCLNYIIVVDNESTDDSFEKIKEYEDERIIVLASGKNGGYGYGNNVGLKYANDVLHCDYSIIANPDVIFEEKVVIVMTDFLKKHNDYAVVVPFQTGTKKQAWKETGVFKDQLFYSIILNKIFNPRYYPDEYFQKKICDVYSVKGCFLMFRSSVLKEIDYYDEDFFLFEEEKVIAKKLKYLNYKSAVLTDINYIHNHSVTIKKNFKKFGQSKKIVLKSNELFLKKYMNVGKNRMVLIKIYHLFCILESIIYDFIRSIISK